MVLNRPHDEEFEVESEDSGDASRGVVIPPTHAGVAGSAAMARPQSRRTARPSYGENPAVDKEDLAEAAGPLDGGSSDEDDGDEERGLGGLLAPQASMARLGGDEMAEDGSFEESEGDRHAEVPRRTAAGFTKLGAMGGEGGDEEEEEGDDDDDEEEEEEGGGKLGLPVDPSLPSEVKELFGKISRYEPTSITIPTKIMPFIPDYIACVGDLDAFLKMPRPDGKEDLLGLAVLDEPAARQSNPSILLLQIKALARGGGGGSSAAAEPHAEAVGRVATGQPMAAKQISQWIESVESLRRSKPADSFEYPKPMPSLEDLMQVWPAEMEGLLAQIRLPGANLDVSLEEFAKLCCAIVDIPVYGNSTIPSLHLLFSLFAEFEASQHFFSERRY